MKIGVLSLATGRYLDYWHDMVLSAENYLTLEGYEITLHVFTNRVDDASAIAQRVTKFDIRIHEIPPYVWPEATLLRYRCIEKIAAELEYYVLMHLDADMLVIQDFIKKLDFTELEGGIGLVAHPGYWRPKGFSLIKLYLSHPEILASDLRTYLKFGALGAWERRPKSRAFVPRKLRETYVCGGTWFGLRHEFLSMVSECAKNVDTDIANGKTAIWHDESHLNKWLVGNRASKLEPSFCFDPSYPQIQSMPEFIRAVDKSK